MKLTVESIKNERAGEVSVVHLSGTTLDAGNAKEFKTQIARLLNPGARIVLDMTELKFVDSSGLGAMVSTLRQVNGAGGDLRLSGLSKPVRALLELVRMHRVFGIYNSGEEAVESFASQPS